MRFSFQDRIEYHAHVISTSELPCEFCDFRVRRSCDLLHDNELNTGCMCVYIDDRGFDARLPRLAAASVIDTGPETISRDASRCTTYDRLSVGQPLSKTYTDRSIE